MYGSFGATTSRTVVETDPLLPVGSYNHGIVGQSPYPTPNDNSPYGRQDKHSHNPSSSPINKITMEGRSKSDKFLSYYQEIRKGLMDYEYGSTGSLPKKNDENPVNYQDPEVIPLQGDNYTQQTFSERLKEYEKTLNVVHCKTCKSTTTELKRCKGCDSVYYCNRECQKKNWPLHKKDCRK